MADGRPFKWGRVPKPKKTHLPSPLRDRYIKYERNPPVSFRDLLQKQNENKLTPGHTR